MLDNVDKIENFYAQVKEGSLTSNKASGKNDIHDFIVNNMRMSICEMG
jgi:hypothetical protein